MAGVLLVILGGSGSAATAADFNGDGRDDIALGLPRENLDGFDYAGAVEILNGSNPAGLTDGSKLISRGLPWMKGDGLAAGARFGTAVAGGDFDGDGLDDLAVGNPADGTPISSGTVQIVYSRHGGLGPSNSELKAELPQAVGLFGQTLAVGNFDGDRFDDLVVGSPGPLLGNPSPKALGFYIYYGSRSGLSRTRDSFFNRARLGLDPERCCVGLGSAFAVGHFKHGKSDDLVVGLPFFDRGRVQILKGTRAGLTSRGSKTIIDGQKGLRGGYFDAGSFSDDDLNFGRYLASGDLNGDNLDDLVVGTPRKDLNNFSRVGAVHIIYAGRDGLGLRGNQYTPETNRKLPGSHFTPGANGFGAALAIGNFDGRGPADLAIGAPIGDAVTLVFGHQDSGLMPLKHARVIQAGAAPMGGTRHYGGFGVSLATANLNGRGADELLVHEPQNPFDDPDDPGTCDSGGALHVFYPSSSGDPFGSGYRFLIRDSAGMPDAGSQVCDFFGDSLLIGSP